MKKSQLTPIALLAISICSQAFAETPMQSVEVTADRTAAQKYQIPNTVESTTSEKIAETVNIVDTPDALKYMPSLMVRKRDSADFGGATLATRIWGVSYSAKSIVTVDGMPISSQLYNDNNYGPPKWFVVSPEEIDRIDVMYGPFSAAYSGNSMGAVVDITTKRPTKELEGSVSVTDAIQTFKQFGTNDTYDTKQAAALLGGRNEAMSWRLMFNHQDANTQPRAFATGASPATPYPYITKTGATGSYYLGANTMLHGVSDNINAKLKFDLNRDTQLSLSSGVFMGDTDASAKTYMSSGYCANGAGAQCTTGASGVYGYKQEHWVNGMGLKSDTRGVWDYELNLSNVRYANDVQRGPTYLNNDGSVVNNSPTVTKYGTVRDMSGTNWTNFDAKAIYRPEQAPAHQLSFGYHQDFAKLNNTTNNVQDWQNSNTAASLNALAQGISETKAVWAQDAYKASDNVRYTVGGRYETWTSHDGGVYTKDGDGRNQPTVSANHFSPKLATLLDLKDGGLLNLSLANAYRFPTVGELYNVTTCTTGCSGSGSPYAYSPNPGIIKPENVNAFEAAYSKSVDNVSYRASFFAEDTKDALISQYGYVNPAQPTGLYSYWMNVTKVRSRGVELSSNIEKFISNKIDLFSAITRVDSVIAANDGYGYGTSSAKSVVGNKTPGVSPLRVKFVATYRADEQLSIALGGSYQKQFYSTVDNNDTNPNTYQGFEGYTLFDLKVRYKVDKNLSASLGVDNLTNRNYFLYHPFPQRTFIGNLKYNF
jgi:iron complex outermembrane receptor protein